MATGIQRGERRDGRISRGERRSPHPPLSPSVVPLPFSPLALFGHVTAAIAGGEREKERENGGRMDRLYFFFRLLRRESFGLRRWNQSESSTQRQGLLVERSSNLSEKHQLVCNLKLKLSNSAAFSPCAFQLQSLCYSFEKRNSSGTKEELCYATIPSPCKSRDCFFLLVSLCSIYENEQHYQGLLTTAASRRCCGYVRRLWPQLVAVSHNKHTIWDNTATFSKSYED